MNKFLTLHLHPLFAAFHPFPLAHSLPALATHLQGVQSVLLLQHPSPAGPTLPGFASHRSSQIVLIEVTGNLPSAHSSGPFSVPPSLATLLLGTHGPQCFGTPYCPDFPSTTGLSTSIPSVASSSSSKPLMLKCQRPQV